MCRKTPQLTFQAFRHGTGADQGRASGIGTLARSAAIALGLAALLLALQPAAHKANAQEPLKVTLAITDVDIECREGCDHVDLSDPWRPTIGVALGTLLQFTFVWAHQGYITEEHIMVLEGYNLEWDKIDRDHREASLQLIADKPGKFTVKCDTECELHDFTQNITLEVGETGGKAAAKTPSVLVLKPSERMTTGEAVNIMVTLKGEDAKPVPKANIDFFVDTSFAGTQGEMKIVTAETDEHGVAFVDFKPTLPVTSETLTARFDGLGIYDGTEQKVVIQTIGPMPPAYLVPDVGLDELRATMPRAFGATILAIWLVLGFIVLQIFGIQRARPGA